MGMKLMLIVLALATAATAQVFLPGSATMVDAFPRSMPTPQGQIDMATPAQWIEAGGRYATAQEVEDAALAAEAAALEAEAARQLAKPLSLKQAENNFFLMCAALFQGDLSKRGFAELGAAVEAYTAVDPQAGVVLAIKLLTVDAEAKREGGLQWWDDARFHPEIVE